MPTATPEGGASGGGSSTSAALTASEIRALHKELGKAMSQDAQKDILVILDKLKAGVVPTEDIIRSTKIGQIVGKLRANANSQVASQAKSLVQGWKAIIDQERGEKGKKDKERDGVRDGASSSSSTTTTTTPTSNSANATATQSTTTSTSSRGGSSTPAAASAVPGSASPAASTPTSVAPTASTSTPAPAPAPAPTPALPPGKKPDFTALNDKTRNACLKVLFDAIKTADVPGLHEDQVFAITLAAEQSIFDRLCPAKDVTADYRNKVRSLSVNLKDKNNPTFRRRVATAEILPSRLVDLTPKEMASEERLAEYKTLEQQNMLVAQSAAEQEAETDAFQCGRCKQRKCRYYQKQTRSADEPMTTFVTCTNCNNKWKFC